jgi:stalled ribosome rescue protein Dom34
MKIVERGFEKGFVKVIPENFLDLWYLSGLIEVKDKITAKTVRNIFIEREGKKEKSRKKTLILSIEAEKIDLEENKLRIKGKIVEAPEEVQKGSYHTIEIGIGSKVLIEKKEWKKEQIEKIEKAEKRIKKAFSLKDFFIHLNKEDGLAVYGIEEVKNSALIGAIKTLFVPLEKLDKEIEKIMEEVENKGGEIEFVSKKEELGKKFIEEYRIGAILRFKIS